MSLRDRREKLRKRETRVDELVRKNEKDVNVLHGELKEEREERDELGRRRKDLKEELDEEIRKDEKGKGEHPEHWEDWANSRRDELADMLEASEARSDRLVKRVIHEKDRVDELERRDRNLEQRINRLNKQIAEIAQDREGRLSKDFHVREFDCRNGTKVPGYMEGALKDLCQNHLQPLRDSGGTVGINSGYRTASYNAAIGGEPNSYHIYDVRKSQPAADHVQAGRAAPSVAAWHESHHDGTIGLGRYSSFTHLDTRAYESRWYG